MEHHKIEPFDMVLDQFAGECNIANHLSLGADREGEPRIDIGTLDHPSGSDKMGVSADTADTRRDDEGIEGISPLQNRLHPPKMQETDSGIFYMPIFIGLKIEYRFPLEPLDQLMRYHRSTTLQA